MKVIAIEMSANLRQAFKTACAIDNITMRDALVKETNQILDNNELTYDTYRPKRGEGMCLLCINAEEDFIEKVKNRKRTEGDKIRDIYITAIINYLDNSQIDYDYSDDLKDDD